MADQIAVDDRGVIRTFSGRSARRVGIHGSWLLGNGIVIDHGIHIASANQKSKLRCTKARDGRIILPVRLCDDPNGVTVGFEHPRNDRISKGWMIDICIPDNVYEIELLDSLSLHIFF